MGGQRVNHLSRHLSEVRNFWAANIVPEDISVLQLVLGVLTCLDLGGTTLDQCCWNRISGKENGRRKRQLNCELRHHKQLPGAIRRAHECIHAC